MPTPAEMAPTPTLSPTSARAITPTDQSRVVGPSREPLLTEAEKEAATLGSLAQVDDFPLYTMRYYADYHGRRAAADDRADGGWASHVGPPLETFGERVSVRERMPGGEPVPTGEPVPAWACSLFAALGDADNMLYGRNFDWRHSPALLLFADPPDGYASVSMVDIAYLGF